MFRASLLLKCNNICNTAKSGAPTAEDVHKFSNEVDAMSHDELINFVHDQVGGQVTKMFTSIEKGDIMRNDHHSNVSSAVLNAKEKSLLLDELNYALACKESSISNSGEGVYISAPNGVYPGTVVCLYPGLVHLKEYLRDRDYLSSLLPDENFMLMARLDEALIDGRSADVVPHNPYALGHKVNHCGSLRKPNVMQVLYVNCPFAIADC